MTVLSENEMKKKISKKITRDKWIWMPHPAHFICSHDCKFVMATKVGKYIVSTVGEYFPDAPIREINVECRGIKLEGKGDARRANYMQKLGFEDIGYNRKYETMVFKAQSFKKKYPKETEICCPFAIIVSKNTDSNGYNKASDAFKGHYKMCDKWSKL